MQAKLLPKCLKPHLEDLNSHASPPTLDLS
jgi:hypothetical protein